MKIEKIEIITTECDWDEIDRKVVDCQGDDVFITLANKLNEVIDYINHQMTPEELQSSVDVTRLKH